jgi:hypothetical protein
MRTKEMGCMEHGKEKNEGKLKNVKITGTLDRLTKIIFIDIKTP